MRGSVSGTGAFEVEVKMTPTGVSVLMTGLAYDSSVGAETLTAMPTPGTAKEPTTKCSSGL